MSLLLNLVTYEQKFQDTPLPFEAVVDLADQHWIELPTRYTTPYIRFAYKDYPPLGWIPTAPNAVLAAYAQMAFGLKPFTVDEVKAYVNDASGFLVMFDVEQWQDKYGPSDTWVGQRDHVTKFQFQVAEFLKYSRRKLLPQELQREKHGDDA